MQAHRGGERMPGVREGGEPPFLPPLGRRKATPLPQRKEKRSLISSSSLSFFGTERDTVLSQNEGRA